MKNSLKRFAAVAALLATVLWIGDAEAAYYGPVPLGVTAGGTGAATLTAHGVVVGEGTSAVAAAGPGATAGVALVSGGASADPSFTTVLPVGGGTGLATLTAHNVMLGEGTSNVAFAAPGATVGVPLISQNATTDPVFGVASVAGGGTGVATWTSAAIPLGAGTSAITFLSEVDGDCVKGVSGAWTASTCGTGAVPTWAVAATSASITLASTNLLTTGVGNTTVATATLPSAVTVGSGFRECIKDSGENFASHNVTLKATAGTIDTVAAATGIVLNQQYQEYCAISDGTNWWIE